MYGLCPPLCAGAMGTLLLNMLTLFRLAIYSTQLNLDFRIFIITMHHFLHVKRSMDHRGTSEFPGFVVTLVKEDELKDHQSHREGDKGCNGDIYLPECIGNVYLVPQEEANALIGEWHEGM